MDQAVLHQVLSGLATGAIYGSVALALVMIYKSTHIVNFAQGELAMFSTYFSLVLIINGVPYWFAFIAAVLFSFALGVAIERLLMRPLANAPLLPVVVVTVGQLVILNSVAGWLFSYESKAFPSPFDSLGWNSNPFLSPHEMGVVVVTLVVLALVFCFFRFTSLGLAMRAAALSPAASRLVGIRVSRMLAIGWGLAAAVGAVAGMMAAPIVFLDPNMMGTIMLYAFAGALLGGISNPWGAVIGGLIVGVLENLGGAYLVGPDLKLTVALAVILIIVTLKPEGLFGQTITVRV